MLITGTFGDRAAQQAILKVEHDTFKPLKAHGIYDFAHSAYERYADELGIEKTQHTQNAYLLQFMNIAVHSGNIDQYSLEGIEFVFPTRLMAAKLIKEHGQEYLKTIGHDAPPSDDLCAASIGVYTMKIRPDTMTMTALIGQDSVNLIAAHNYLLKHKSIGFEDTSFTPEAKTLHLAHMTAITKDAALLVSRMNDVAPADPLATLNEGLTILECIQNINPLPKTNELEAAAYKEMRLLENILPRMTQKYIHCFENAVEPPSPNIHSI